MPTRPEQPPAVVQRSRGAASSTSRSAAAEPQAELPPQWITLGSVDPADPYRMLVTITNRGAAVERIELNEPATARPGGRWRLPGTPRAGGCAGPRRRGWSRVVGKGTPAATAGLQAGDVITAIDGAAIKGRLDLRAALRQNAAGTADSADSSSAVTTPRRPSRPRWATRRWRWCGRKATIRFRCC